MRPASFLRQFVSQTTMNQPVGQSQASAPRLAVVVSRYNESITERLLQGALQTAERAGIAQDAVQVVRVPGAWEIPLMARWLAESGRVDGIVCLGAVIRGETTHDQHINRFVSLSLGQLAVESGLPVGFGLLTCEDLQQAVQRSGGAVGNKGEEATEAVLEMLRLRSELMIRERD